jgi:hypothetical protein
MTNAELDAIALRAECELQRSPHVVTFRATSGLIDAMDKASTDDMCSRSDIARRALVDHLRQRGLLPEVRR